MDTAVREIVIIDSKEDKDDPFSHITMCKEILKACIPGIEPVCMEIGMDESGKGNIHELILALYNCLEKRPAVISLSIGSVRPSDFYCICSVIRQLVKSGVWITAALSNQGYPTIPASLPEVIGVIAENKLLDEPHLYNVQTNGYGVDLCASYKDMSGHGEAFNLRMVGNSFAVPVVAAALYKKYIENIGSKREVLDLFPRKIIKWTDQMWKRHVAEFNDRPRVRFTGIDFSYQDWQRGFLYLAVRHKVEAVMESDFNEVEWDLHFIKDAIIAVDIIFERRNIGSIVDVDILVNRNASKTIYQYEGKEKCYYYCQGIEQILDEIIEILS